MNYIKSIPLLCSIRLKNKYITEDKIQEDRLFKLAILVSFGALIIDYFIIKEFIAIMKMI